MVRLTRELIRKKAEHHDGILEDLEEISLHQMEIEKIEVIGSICRKLKILYLQNNIISKIEDLNHMRNLRYINLALNNITRIGGLSNCEFLEKLDLTVNFVDLDELEVSINHLADRMHLRELYLMGNPCTEWTGYRPFVIANLGSLQILDGKEISRRDRIEAEQQIDSLKAELRVRAREAFEKKKEKQKERRLRNETDSEDENEWSPEARVKMYREMAEQKEEKERNQRKMEPPERNYELEHAERVKQVREFESSVNNSKIDESNVEQTKVIRQCNEGRWSFFMDEETGTGEIELRIMISKFLDTSLIDADVHPSYASIVIKGKLFRILWPEPVISDSGSCQRSQTTGELVIRVKKEKANPRFMMLVNSEKKNLENRVDSGSSSTTGSSLRNQFINKHNYHTATSLKNAGAINGRTNGKSSEKNTHNIAGLMKSASSTSGLRGLQKEMLESAASSDDGVIGQLSGGGEMLFKPISSVVLDTSKKLSPEVTNIHGEGENASDIKKTHIQIDDVDYDDSEVPPLI